MYNTVFNQEFGKLVVKARTTKNMTQANLAKKLNFSAQYLGRVERGTVRMPLAALRKTKTILDIPTKTISEMARDAAKTYTETILK